MEIVLSDDSKYQEPLETRLFKFATTLIGAEIDFVIKSVDEANRVVVASRKETLVDKIRTYYATLDKDKVSMIGNNPDVQARVISVGRKNLGVEVFGVQTQINAKDVFYEWVVDLRNDFSAGDVILVNVEKFFLEQ